MRQIFKYIKIYVKEELKLNYFLSICIFLSLSVFIEYKFHITQELLNPLKQTIFYLFANILLYSLPLLFAIWLYIILYKRSDLIGNRNFWMLVSFIVVAYAFRAYFYQHKHWAIQFCNGNYDRYIIKCTNQFVQALLVCTPVVLFWIFSGDNKKMNLYGFQLKNFNTKPYFAMLVIMLPLIAVASTQHDFLNRYPTFHDFISESETKSIMIFKTTVYELLYGSDFVMTELFFRGFMVFTLASFMGKGCILPMATMYLFIHFGKPVGETISSFFGGTILGIIAYETRSIIGGIIVHCGTAYIMELGGAIGHFLIKTR